MKKKKLFYLIESEKLKEKLLKYNHISVGLRTIIKNKIVDRLNKLGLY